MLRSIGRWLNEIQAGRRLLFCLGAALAVLAVLLLRHMQLLTGILLSWDVFCGCIIGLSWIMFATIPHEEVCSQAQRQDESRTITFMLVLGAGFVSMFGILILMRPLDAHLIDRSIHRGVSLLGVGLSWILMHTVFTLRYAHLYYTDPNAAPDDQVGGLEFPAEKRPDYLDFAYFSFIIGMTFQVSDVTISTRKIRRVVLLHSLIAFVFNTIVVALTISILSGLGK